jgi:hypothetical protein
MLTAVRINLLCQLTNSYMVYVATADDENVAKLLRQYHSDGITDKKIISSLLAKKGYPMR